MKTRIGGNRENLSGFFARKTWGKGTQAHKHTHTLTIPSWPTTTDGERRTTKMTMKKRQAVSQSIEGHKRQSNGHAACSSSTRSLSLSLFLSPSVSQFFLSVFSWGLGCEFHPPFKLEFLANTSFGVRENDPYSPGRPGSHNSFFTF